MKAVDIIMASHEVQRARNDFFRELKSADPRAAEIFAEIEANERAERAIRRAAHKANRGSNDRHR